jgi:hypothetical protein
VTAKLARIVPGTMATSVGGVVRRLWPVRPGGHLAADPRRVARREVGQPLVAVDRSRRVATMTTRGLGAAASLRTVARTGVAGLTAVMTAPRLVTGRMSAGRFARSAICSTAAMPCWTRCGRAVRFGA